MEQYIESTRKGKTLFYGSLFLIVIAAWGFEIVLRSIDTSDNANSLAFEQQITKAEKLAMTEVIIVLTCQPVIWLIAWAFYRFGKKIRASEQFPPYGSNMPFRTKIYRGKKAIIQARGYTFFSVIMTLLGLMYLSFSLYNLQLIKQLIRGL